MMQVVWLASYPRSGVTFLRLLLERLYGVPTYSIYADEWKATNGLFPSGRYFPHDMCDTGPSFVKTHEIHQAPKGGAAIHLVRDPRDVMVSHAHFATQHSHKYMGITEALYGAVRGELGVPQWGIHTVAWLGRPAVRIHFEDLVADPIGEVRKAIDELDLGMDIDEAAALPEFDKLKEKYPKMFRSGKSGQWHKELPEHLLAEFIRVQRGAIQAYEEVFGRQIVGETRHQDD